MFFFDADDHLHQHTQAWHTLRPRSRRNADWYLAGSLPRLPFGNKSFGLVLSSYLLFGYADRFNFNFHLAAARELVRACRGEVKIFPLVAMEIHANGNFDELRTRLSRCGIESDVRSVGYEFQVSADQLLTLCRLDG